MTDDTRRVVAPDRRGQRLDRVLEVLFPELGLRARRRLFSAFTVFVDGVPRPPAYKVRAGQRIDLAPLSKPLSPPLSPVSPSVSRPLSPYDDPASPDCPGPLGPPGPLGRPDPSGQPGQPVQSGPSAQSVPSGSLGQPIPSDLPVPSDQTGQPGSSGQPVSSGQPAGAASATLFDPSGPSPWPDAAAPPRFVFGQGDYIAFFKPPGLHTASLGPGGGPSLEDLLDRLAPPGIQPADIRLLTRLDVGTSGLVLAALSERAEAAFRAMEDRGQVEKTYLAIVRGRLAGPTVLDRRLDTARRRVTRVLDRPAGPWRTTRLTPLAHDAEAGTTLVRAVIHKGARHQIRVHLAHHGAPVLGDALYGRPRPTAGHGMGVPADGGPDTKPGLPAGHFLHHLRLTFPGFTAAAPPPWTLAADHPYAAFVGAD